MVEEVARIVGFDRIPSTIPPGRCPRRITTSGSSARRRLRDVLVGAGLTEIVTYPLTSRERMAQLLRGTIAQAKSTAGRAGCCARAGASAGRWQ